MSVRGLNEGGEKKEASRKKYFRRACGNGSTLRSEIKKISKLGGYETWHRIITVEEFNTV